MPDLLTACPALVTTLRDAQEVSAFLWDRGWAESNAGNLSIDVSRSVAGTDAVFSRVRHESLAVPCPELAERFFLVTGSGRRFRDFARDAEHNSMLLQLDADGAGYTVLWGGLNGLDFRPTSELPTHLRLHAHAVGSASDLNVVLHTHPTDLIALTHMPDCRHEGNLNRILWSVLPEVKVYLPRGVGLVPYRVPGSDALATATERVVRGGHTVAVWQFHGCLALGASASEAFDRIDTANKAARVALQCRAAGHRVGGLGPAQLAELEREFDLDS
jgi:rhamnulose-1-phosphate aldolase